jgi:hypothetical protein
MRSCAGASARPSTSDLAAHATIAEFCTGSRAATARRLNWQRRIFGRDRLLESLPRGVATSAAQELGRAYNLASLLAAGTVALAARALSRAIGIHEV